MLTKSHGRMGIQMLKMKLLMKLFLINLKAMDIQKDGSLEDCMVEEVIEEFKTLGLSGKVEEVRF